MDTKTLKELISRYAVVIDGNDMGPQGTILKTKKRKPKKIIKIIKNELGEEEVVEELVEEYNPTLPFIVGELKPNNKICELGCGEIVSNQVIYKRHYQSPQSHWKTSCKNCQKGLGPDGKTLIQGTTNIQNAFFKHFNSKQDK